MGIYTLYDRILKNPQDTKNDRLFEEVYAQDFQKLPLKMADHEEIFKQDRTQQQFPGMEGVKEMIRDFRDIIPDFEMERKATILHEDSVIVLSKLSGTIQNIGKIYDGQKKMKFHSCLVFLLRNSSERGLKPCTWVFTALEMARSNKIITLKIGPQLFTKCSTTDLHLTLDLRETLLISKCSIFI